MTEKHIRIKININLLVCLFVQQHFNHPGTSKVCSGKTISMYYTIDTEWFQYNQVKMLHPKLS